MLKAKFFVKCIVLIIAMTSMACSERTYNNETLLIEWTDTNTGLIFRVTERPGFASKSKIALGNSQYRPR